MFPLAAATPSSDLSAAIALLSLVLAVGVAAIFLKRRDAKNLVRHQQASEMASRTHRERESSAFQQHTELNTLAAQKFKREVELLDVQLQLAKFDLGMRHDHRDYHDLVMEKARLEIESLKLHIKEQRKRNDDFGASDEH